MTRSASTQNNPPHADAVQRWAHLTPSCNKAGYPAEFTEPAPNAFTTGQTRPTAMQRLSQTEFGLRNHDCLPAGVRRVCSHYAPASAGPSSSPWSASLTGGAESVKEAVACEVEKAMPTPTHIKIRQTAIDLLLAAADGLRYKNLHRGICEQLPDVSPHVVATTLQTFRHSLPPGFTVARGVYRSGPEAET